MRKARAEVGLPANFRFYDLRHTGHTLATQSGATLKDAMVRAYQSSERAALFYQHSTLERQKEIAAALDARVRTDRASIGGHDDGSSGTQRAREGQRGPDDKEASGCSPGAFCLERVARIELAL